MLWYGSLPFVWDIPFMLPIVPFIVFPHAQVCSRYLHSSLCSSCFLKTTITAQHAIYILPIFQDIQFAHVFASRSTVNSTHCFYIEQAFIMIFSMIFNVVFNLQIPQPSCVLCMIFYGISSATIKFCNRNWRCFSAIFVQRTF